MMGDMMIGFGGLCVLAGACLGYVLGLVWFLWCVLDAVAKREYVCVVAFVALLLVWVGVGALIVGAVL